VLSLDRKCHNLGGKLHEADHVASCKFSAGLSVGFPQGYPQNIRREGKDVLSRQSDEGNTHI
jgi:hypothetical protein